ncbi:uncharacterized protein [Aquarana catesbeiana]|uniref:uncharacterized protein n=1 Tax=Aquarana catesbeiana TaxID=8400 RepID=UPI003CCA556F
MSAGYPAAIQSQPQWQNGSPFSFSTAIVPKGLECLVEVEEVILKDKVFQTKNKKDLFTIHQEVECCGPSLNLRLRKPYYRDVVSLYLTSDGDCCGGQTYLKVCDQFAYHMGNVRIVTSSSNMNVSIERGNGEPVFSVKLPVSLDSNNDSTIEIHGTGSSHPVAFIIKEKEGNSSQVIFHFPLNMEAALKAVILAAFLYVSFSIGEMFRSHSYVTATATARDRDFGWAGAGGVDFGDMSHGGFGGSDWGGGVSLSPGKAWEERQGLPPWHPLQASAWVGRTLLDSHPKFPLPLSSHHWNKQPQWTYSTHFTL